tara:strand:+ start:787 stop:1761 length:975 start_codon:yes stop_codon:yes gene_type:complete
MVCLSLSIRWEMIQSGQVLNDGDLSAYVYNMGVEKTLSYHLREPIFWYGSRYLYIVFGNPGLVFVFMDIILFLTFYKSVGLFKTFFSKHINFHNVKYLYFSAFLFYPYIAGMHNHYRQILAVTIAMCAFGIAEKKPRKALFVFLISIATHNGMVMLLPILLLSGKRKISTGVMTIAGLVTIITLFVPAYLGYFGYDGWSELIRRFNDIGTSDIATGRAKMYLYLLLLTTFFIIILEYSFKARAQYLLIKVLICLTAIYFVGFLLFPNHAASRVFFMVFTLFLPLTGLYVEIKFKTEPTVRLLYFHLSLVPLLGLRGDGLVYEFL